MFAPNFGMVDLKCSIILKLCLWGYSNVRNRLDPSVFVFQLPFLQKFANNYCIWLGSTVICKFSAPRQILRGPRAVVLRRFCVILQSFSGNKLSLWDEISVYFVINDGHIVFHWDEREYVFTNDFLCRGLSSNVSSDLSNWHYYEYIVPNVRLAKNT